MKKYSKTIFLLSVAVVLIIVIPYVKTPGSCGITFPFIFPGAISGERGEQQPLEQSYINEKSMAFASESIKSIKVTFVELGSENCMPCRMMRPVLEKISTKYSGQVKIVYNDVMTKTGRSEGSKYKIRVIPTQVFLDNSGNEYFRHEGFFSFEEVEGVLKRKGVN